MMEASAPAARRLREQPKLPVSLGVWWSSNRFPRFVDHQDAGNHEESCIISIELKDFIERHYIRFSYFDGKVERYTGRSFSI